MTPACVRLAVRSGYNLIEARQATGLPIVVQVGEITWEDDARTAKALSDTDVLAPVTGRGPVSPFATQV